MRRAGLLDLLLLAGFLALLSFTKLPRILHEIIGILIAVGIAAHLSYAKGWIKGLSRGRWDARRAVGTAVNVLLALTALIVLVTGVIGSNFLFRDIIPLELHRNVTLHQLHTALAWLMPILIGLHIGLHGTSLRQRVMRSLGLSGERTGVRITSALLTVLIVGVGVYASILNRVGDRLSMEHIFATEAGMMPAPVFVLLLLALILMYALLGAGLTALLARRGK